MLLNRLLLIYNPHHLTPPPLNHSKKKRGLRRYYKNLPLKNSDWSELNFTDAEQAWFDLWHTHFDWDGYGNTSFKARKPHLDQLIKHLDSLLETIFTNRQRNRHDLNI